MAKRQSSEPSVIVGEAAASQPTFEESLARLDELAANLEEGQLGLGESLACYEEGVKLLKQCYNLLEQAERKIALLSGVDAEGNAVTESFDDTASTLDENAQVRGRRGARSRKPAPVELPTPADSDVDDGELLF